VCVAVCGSVCRDRAYSVLQCVAMCCSVLQCVAVCCSVLQCVLQYVLQCVAVCCSVLQCVAVCVEAVMQRVVCCSSHVIHELRVCMWGICLC